MEGRARKKRKSKHQKPLIIIIYSLLMYVFCHERRQLNIRRNIAKKKLSESLDESENVLRALAFLWLCAIWEWSLGSLKSLRVCGRWVLGRCVRFFLGVIIPHEPKARVCNGHTSRERPFPHKLSRTKQLEYWQNKSSLSWTAKPEFNTTRWWQIHACMRNGKFISMMGRREKKTCAQEVDWIGAVVMSRLE